MREKKRPCFFCKGLKLRKIDFFLIVLICLIMYWVNQYQIAQIDKEQRQKTQTTQKHQ
ncbi:hypothetical protein [Helicobacter brantae]|uniref:hypothetical protein n=1 Tax=Helicobacter brantae TaxID=375927 RepID=UPI001473529C|nr:hypothetical protein [Helicobacter brantae]